MPELAYTYRTLRESDLEAVKRLVDEFLPGFVQNGYWEWKYLLNPDFDRSLIAVTEKDGKVIGCCHWLPGRIKIAKDIEAKAIMATDGVVSPEHRKRGILKSMYLFMRNSRALKSKGAIIEYDFPINKYLGLALGYIPVKSSTRCYLLLRSWKRTIKKFEEANRRMTSNLETRRVIACSNLVLLFRLRGAPPLTINIGKEGMKASEKESEHANVVVEGDLGNFTSLMTGEKTKRQLLKALITRKVRIKGSVFALFRLWRSFDLILEVLRGTS